MRKTVILKRILVLAISIALAVGMVGCSDETTAKNANKTPVDAPDYSDSTYDVVLIGHRGTSAGTFQNASGTNGYYGDFVTLERFKEYQDCGFTMMHASSDLGYDTSTPFEESRLKKVLDLSEELGMKCVIYDQRIYRLSKQTESIIGEDKEFANMDALIAQLKEYMAPYYDHPGFGGLMLMDEPAHELFTAIGEVTKALRTINPDLHLMQCLLPFQTSVKYSTYTGKEEGNTSIEAYKTYVRDYLKNTERDVVEYDKYPFSSTGCRPDYFTNLQTVVTIAQEYGAEAHITMQAYTDDTTTRLPDLDDLYYQANAALSFGFKGMGYYTYFRFPSNASGATLGGVLNYDGSKMIYDEVKEVNHYIKRMGDIVMNFDYQKATIAYNENVDLATPEYLIGVHCDELDNVKQIRATQPVIITQLKDDDKDRTGYMVMNAMDTLLEEEANEITLTFDEFDFATYYVDGKATTVQLENGALELTIDPGRAVFVIPHN